MNPKEIKLTARHKEKLLRNIWLLHDGKWFLRSVKESGFDTATKLESCSNQVHSQNENETTAN